MNIRFILYVLGTLLLIEGGLLILPAIVTLIYDVHYSSPDVFSSIIEYLAPILISSVITFSVGWILLYYNGNCSKIIGKREGFIIVSVVWIVYSAFGALPFIISGSIPSVTNAFFEAMSGFTTTGYTILKNVEILPHGLLFWRSLMHFTGGIGILVLCLAVLPNFGVGSMNIYSAEISAASLVGKISPRVKDTAKYISVIYIILTSLCMLLYLPDMNFFDALCHAFSTTATGGFSTKNASIGAFSEYSQWVAVVFMFFGSTSFILLSYIWKRDFRKIIHNDEFRFFIIVILIASALVLTGLLLNSIETGKAISEAVFNVVNIISTTGFASYDYKLTFPTLWFILFLLAFVGGCAGSTAGGMKIVRFILLFRLIPVQFRKMVHQNAIITVKLNNHHVNEDRMYNTLAFFMIFLCVYTGGVFLLMLSGFDFPSAVSASIACLANLGQGFELSGTARHFSEISTVSKMICILLMLLGRLELYSILILFSPSFWKKQ